MKNSNILFTLLISVGLIGVSCKKEEETTKKDLVVASSYDSSNYKTNEAFYQNVRSNLDQLVVEIKKGRTNGVKVQAETQTTLFESGSPSIASITIPNFKSALSGNNGWFAELANASGNTYHVDSASVNGGTFGGYLFDEKGFEPEQNIEKGLFGAALCNEAIRLLNSNPGLKETDYALGLIGATPHFKSSNNAKHGAAADKYLAVYLARRDKNDGNGFYSQLKNNFIKLQSAINAGADYNKEKEEAIAGIRKSMEEANFATIINYCHTSISNLSLTTLTDAQKASTLHALGECVGFAKGWKEVQSKKITDAQIDEILNLLNDNAKPSTFITNRVIEINKLTEVITRIQSIYGFSEEQVNDFKKNWVSEQNR